MRKTIIDMGADHPLSVNYCPGNSKNLAVVFSGVGSNPKEYPEIEFFRAATQEDQNHVLFICDMNRSWLNELNTETQIIDIVERFSVDHSITDISLIGNSMGGTMALLLAKKIKARTVLAICPQYSVSPDIVPDEKRWMRYRKKISQFNYKEAIPEVTPNQKIFIVHGGTSGELMHAQKFPLVPGIRHFILPQYGHSLARKLNRKKVLSPLVAAVISDRPYRFRKIIEREGGLFMRDFKV